MTDIGTRMKSYEQNRRLADGAVIVRVDGKSFHTWTKEINAKRPFDNAVINCMLEATASTAEHMQGFKLAYTQSDEATFLLTNPGEKEELWFGGKLDKIVSVTASAFTFYFNDRYDYYVRTRNYPPIPAFFDARVHNIPLEDAANNFVWRQQDWIRNSVCMLGRSYFSHKELIGKSTVQVKQMLLDEHGMSWDSLNDHLKYGVFTDKDFDCHVRKLNYDEINKLARIDVE